MKKIISFLLLAAMLVGCMIPAVVVSAADVTLAAESVEKMEGTGSDVSPKITIANNPGIYSIKLVVYYDKAQLAKSDADPFAGSVFGTDSNVGSQRAGTHKDIKAYVPAELQATSAGFVVDLCGTFDEELGDTAIVTEDGIAVALPLSIAATDYGTFAYNVVVAEAYDADGNELEIADVAGTITYAADPLIGIYEDFTVFMDPAEADVTKGTKTISVDLRFDNNPGLWSTRVYVVYPDTISLKDDLGNANVTNSTGIFLKTADLITGVPDLAFDDSRIVQGFADLIKADPSIAREGYVSTTLYFERTDSFDQVYEGNGVLCTLNFEVSEDVEIGDVLDIVFYYGEMDFLYAGTDENGAPVFVDYYPDTFGANFNIIEKVCAHATTTTEHLDPTCGVAGYDRVVCTDECGKVLSETVLPATGNHTEGAPVVVDPTCGEAGSSTVSCSVCGTLISETEIPATGEHTPGAAPTCQTAQTCTVCGEALAAPIDHIEDEPVITNPTCVEDGKRVYNCTMCGEYIREETIEKTGHLYLQPQNSVVTPPTCTTDGYTTRYCDVCNEPNVVDPVPAWGHDEDGEVVIVDATCIAEGTKTIYCDTCGEISKVETIPVKDTHNLEHVDAVPAYCHTNGCNEYWYCVDCDAVYSDAEGRYLTNRKNLVIPAENTLVFVPGAEACHVPGIQDYWYCPACDCVYADAEGTQLTNRKNLEIEADCALVYVPAAEACHVPGSAEYWYCPECEAVYADEAGTQLTNRKNLAIAPDCELAYVPAAEACHVPGCAEYWYCPECEAVYADEAGTQLTNRKNLEIAPDCELAYVPAAEACHVPGCAEYWYCPECEAVYADEAGTQLTNRKNLEIAPDCELVYMEKVDACHANGTEEYWFCPDCEAVYADEAGTVLTNRKNLTIPADSEAKHVEAVAPTCTENGMAEYWYCEECDTFFSDADCKYNVAYLSLTLLATGHDYVDGVCSVCGDKLETPADPDDNKPEDNKPEDNKPEDNKPEDNKPEDPKPQDKPQAPVTGDNMIFIIIALSVVIVATAAIVIIRRKRSSN